MAACLQFTESAANEVAFFMVYTIFTVWPLPKTPLAVSVNAGNLLLFWAFPPW
jgi:hypothetical protein